MKITKKLIVLNFAKTFHLEKQCLIVEEEEYSIDAVYCDALVLKDAKEICNRLLFEELGEVKNYCRRIEGEIINKSKLNFMFVLRDVLSNLSECQYFHTFEIEVCCINAQSEVVEVSTFEKISMSLLWIFYL